MAKDAYYFSHDSNARHDPKIVKLLSKYPIGYQWYFMIIEILREQKDYEYPLDEFTNNALAYELHTDCNTIESFLNDCISTFQLFDTNGNYFWSNSLLERMKYLDLKKDKLRANINKRWDKYRANKELNTNEIQLNNNCNTSKVKESKVKEVKEKIIDNIHPLQIYVKENYKLVTQLKNQLTFKECENLIKDYPKTKIIEILDSMENYQKLTKSYTSVNLTIRKWIKRDKPNEVIINNGTSTALPRETILQLYKQ